MLAIAVLAPLETILVTLTRSLNLETGMRPESLGRLTNVQRCLVEMDLFTDAEWDEAVRRAGSDRLSSILAELQRIPAQWDVGHFALTRYQAEQILIGEVQALRFQNYVVLASLGDGLFGKVYQVRNLKTHRVEVIKILLEEWAWLENGAKARYLQEAMPLYRLEHPCLPRVKDIGIWNNIPFASTEFFAGQDLDALVKSKRANGEFVSVPWATEKIVTVAQALTGLYSLVQDGFHCNIKPRNILLTPAGDVLLLDFGFAKLSSIVRNDPSSNVPIRGLVKLRDFPVTPDFLSPERMLDLYDLSPAADVYSLGCTYYYLLTGELPFPADSAIAQTAAHCSAPRPKARKLRLDVPFKLDAVIAKMMAPAPKDRYQSAAQVIEALQPFLTTLVSASKRFLGLPAFWRRN